MAIDRNTGNILVAWISEAASPKAILSRYYKKIQNSWSTIRSVSTTEPWTSKNFGINVDQGPSIVFDSKGLAHLAYIQNYEHVDYGRVHYCQFDGNIWIDIPLHIFTHDPLLTITSYDTIYLFGHGHQMNPGNSCKNRLHMCVTVRDSANGAFGLPSLLQAPSSVAASFDSSPSSKWSAVGWNRPETVELIWFMVVHNNYYGPLTLWYSQITDPLALTLSPPLVTPDPENPYPLRSFVPATHVNAGNILPLTTIKWIFVVCTATIILHVFAIWI